VKGGINKSFVPINVEDSHSTPFYPRQSPEVPEGAGNSYGGVMVDQMGELPLIINR